jgi:uncharacterized membrane protein
MYRVGFFGHGGGGPHLLGILFFVVFLAAVGALILLAVQRTRRGPALAGPTATPDVALDEARTRYARGEIGQEEFLRISTDLRAHPPGPQRNT